MSRRCVDISLMISSVINPLFYRSALCLMLALAKVPQPQLIGSLYRPTTVRPVRQPRSTTSGYRHRFARSTTFDGQLEFGAQVEP